MASNYNFGENEPIITETGDTVNTFGIKVKNLFSDLYSKLNTDWNTMASTSNAGLMSSSDKSKVDNLSSSGNAPTATKLATARTIALSGGATGTATSFDGSSNITIPVTSLDTDKLDEPCLKLTGGTLTGNLTMTDNTKIITSNIDTPNNITNLNIHSGGDNGVGTINISTENNSNSGIKISRSGYINIISTNNGDITIQSGSSSVLKITRNGLTYNGKKVLTES